MNLNELYTQIITENSRSKQNRHPVEGATHSLEGVNPSCGDDITLQLRVMDGKIEDAGFIGTGCAISQASASLMIDLVKGRTVEDARRLIGLYFDMIKGKITPEQLDDSGKRLPERRVWKSVTHRMAAVGADASIDPYI